MLELRHLEGGTYLIEGPVQLGLYVRDGRAILIDSGLDGGVGKKVIKLLEAKGWALSGLINTHAHADHIGGNALLVARTGCPVWASAEERPLIEQPWLQAGLLYGGAPFGELTKKHTQAAPSRVCHTLPQALPEGLAVLPLPGHSPGMVGVMTGDGVLFLADSLLGPEQLAKHGIAYLWDVGRHLASLDLLAQAQADWFVPSHAPACRAIGPLLTANRAHIQAVLEALLEAAAEPVGEEALMAGVCQGFGAFDTPLGYVLARNTLRGYLSYLLGQGRLSQTFVEGRRVLQIPVAKAK